MPLRQWREYRWYADRQLGLKTEDADFDEGDFDG